MLKEYTVGFQLTENPYEMFYISKYVAEKSAKLDGKIIQAMVELLVDGYLQNTSEENISDVFDLLIINQNEDIDWSSSKEINDLLEKYF